MGLINRKDRDLTPIWSKAPRRVKKTYIKKNRKIDPFRLYKKMVDDITATIAKDIVGIENRGFKSYHIDHKISIQYGYSHGIPVEHIAHITNVRMLWYTDNMLKASKCIIDDDNRWIIKG